MPTKITYFVHGTTTDNEEGISSGWKDVGLSELGIKQSHELREKIRGQKFDAVFSSDLKRAMDSARIVFADFPLIISDTRLRECNYGMYNGESTSIVEPLKEKYINERFPEGESYEDVKARVVDFLTMLKDNHNGKRVAVVSHEAPQLALDVLLNHKTWKQAFEENWRKTKSWQPGWEYTA